MQCSKQRTLGKLFWLLHEVYNLQQRITHLCFQFYFLDCIYNGPRKTTEGPKKRFLILSCYICLKGFENIVEKNLIITVVPLI